MNLYLRSRGVPALLATLAALALLTWWCAQWLMDTPRFGTSARVPVVSLAPLLAGVAVASSLYAHSAELDRTAARPLGRLRAWHLALSCALFAGVLGATVTVDPGQFGAQAMVRNVLGMTGIAALSAVAFGARLSWLPPLAYTGAAYLSAPRVPGGWGAVWAWPMQPGPQPAAWCTALALLATGAALCARPGPRVTLGRG